MELSHPDGYSIAATDYLIIHVEPPVSQEQIDAANAMARYLAWLDERQPDQRAAPRAIPLAEALEIIPDEEWLAEERGRIRQAFDLDGTGDV